MIYPLIGPRLHGWLDDTVALIYLGGAAVLGLQGAALGIAIFGALVHFLLTRLTSYPQGTLPLLTFRQHAFVELAEGVAVLAATSLLLGNAPGAVRLFLMIMGASQLGAFAFSDYSYRPVGSGAPGGA